MTDQLKSEPESDNTQSAGPGVDGGQAKATESAQAPAARRSKKRIIRTALLLILVALVAMGYIKRRSLATIFIARASGETASSEQKPGPKVRYWVDPMNPSHKSDKPGKAPDGMDLVPVYEGGERPANVPEGSFQITPEKQQFIGVTYGEVLSKPVSKTLRTVGRLAFDETRIVRIHTKFEGWIENVFVDFTGKLVEKGQPLISIYSPDLVQTQQEYLIAMKGRNELAESPFREAVAGADSLYDSARKRLDLWDITDEQIKALEKRGTPNKALTLYAPSSGFVLTRNAYPKQRVTPETELYAIADLSTVWVIADIYEYEAPEIQVGQPASMALTYFPGRTFRGTVSYIYPQLDNATRTLKVRLQFPNAGFVLKPDMYANVEIKIDYGKKVVVPQEAVLDSGSEQLVFVSHEGGYFEPRKIQLGPKVDTTFIVLAGLKPGEKIVTSANFLVDSESRLKTAASGMGMPGMPGMNNGGPTTGAQQTPAEHSGHNQSAEPQSKTPMDHSQHQARPARTQKQEDHSSHKADSEKPQAGEDHSGHQAKPQDHSQHNPPEAEDHSRHGNANAADSRARNQKPTRKILYWYDPMNPSHRSNKPGKAPDGMDLVPKYANEK